MSLYKHSKALLLASVLLTGAQAQIGDFTNSGKVVDDKGVPVANAYIRYLSKGKEFVTTYSDDKGVFPSKGTVSARHAGSISVNRDNSMMVGGKLYFSIEKDNSPVSIDLYNVSGKKVASVFNQNIKSAGSYSINPLVGFSSKLSQSIYVVKGKIGSNTFAHELCNIQTADQTAGLQRENSVAMQSTPTLAKRMAVDKIRIGKTGYKSIEFDIADYKENVGQKTITLVDVEAKIKEILSNMSWEQKIAQMAQDDNRAATQSVGTYLWGAGSGLNAGQYESSQSKWMNAEPKIPLMAGYDVVHGVIKPAGTIIPHNSALGCITDTLLIQKVFRMVALESASYGCYWAFAPCIAVARDEHWGRIYESPSEDPVVASRFAKHAVLGFQGRDLSDPTTIAATLKHFVGDGGTRNGTNAGNCDGGSDKILRSIHLPPFKAGIDAGAAVVMPSFSLWRGLHMHASPDLLTDWLKVENKFQGFVVGDWNAHMWAMDYGAKFIKDDDVKEGTRQSILAGLDNPMCPGSDWKTGESIVKMFKTDMKEMVDADLAGIKDRINDAVSRMLRVKIWMGLYDNQKMKALSGDLATAPRSPEHWEVARQCVRESMVLLKNEGKVLPLDKKASKITVIGEWGDNVGLQCGGWTLGWTCQTSNEGINGTSLLTALKGQASGATVDYSKDGSQITGDVVVVTIGAKYVCEYTKPDAMLTLSKFDGFTVTDITKDPPEYESTPDKKIECFGTIKELMDKAVASKKKIVLVLYVDAPVVITEYIALADAVVCVWLPGVAGEGMADVLYGGEYDFKGKLAWTWPKTLAQIPINFGDMGDTKKAPASEGLYQLGYGKTYKDAE